MLHTLAFLPFNKASLNENFLLLLMDWQESKLTTLLVAEITSQSVVLPAVEPRLWAARGTMSHNESSKPSADGHMIATMILEAVSV